jgi:FMN-dependent oxidoreductase (nitrilotriacetate monooxygenase family)
MSKPWTIGMFQCAGPMGTWQLAGNTSTDFLDLDHWIAMARRCEAAGVDFLFFADDYGYPVLHDQIPPVSLAKAVQFPRCDPMMIIPALAAATQTLGLVITASTTIEKPPIVARKFATLDHFTRGRIGWNIVTGAGQNASARLFGESMVAHDQRYEIADNHVDLSLHLWEGCWDDDGLVADRRSGVYADPARVREIEHTGPYFSAKGLLTVPPSPQRTPTLFQAGASSKGRDLAAKYAEAVFLAAEPPAMAEQVADIRRRAAGFGRSPGAIKFLLAGTFRVAATTAEAQRRRDQQIALGTLEEAAAAYAFFTGLDLLSMDLDQPLATTATETGRTNVERFTGTGEAPAPTVREILEEFRRNHVMGAPFLGDPAQVVDQAAEVLALTGADGFLVQPDWAGGFDSFIDLVMPELARRGLLKQLDRAGLTLREQLFGAGRPRLSQDHPGTAYRPAPALR